MTDVDRGQATTTSRSVAFGAGAFNVRDLGGLRTRAGEMLRKGCVYRGDGLHRLPADDVERLGRLGVRTVIDLRTTGELDVAASVAGNGIIVVHLPVLRNVWPHDAFTDEETSDPVAFLLARYVEMLDEGRDAIAAVFDLLASETSRPLAFHCSAGKDRTGVVAALILGLLDVADDDIAEDYAASAEAMEQLVAWVRQHRPEAADAMSLQPKAILSCPAATMHSLLDHIRGAWGSVSGYLSSIGVSDETMATVRTALLAP